MQTLLTSVSNPRWANTERTLINCEITTSQLGDEVLPFTASPVDVELHGRVLFARLAAGEFGLVAEAL